MTSRASKPLNDDDMTWVHSEREGLRRVPMSYWCPMCNRSDKHKHSRWERTRTNRHIRSVRRWVRKHGMKVRRGAYGRR